ncbi:MAG: hypothetical protein ABI349_07900 [Casimicrobiaceae bacterium]
MVASSGSARFVAQALIAHWRATDELSSADDAATIAPADGPVFVLAGSQSATTARQIDAACAQRDGAGPLFHRVTLDALAIVGRPEELEASAQCCARSFSQGRAVLAHTAPASEGGPATLEVARARGRLLARAFSNLRRLCGEPVSQAAIPRALR